jgi:hypothetical protein
MRTLLIVLLCAGLLFFSSDKVAAQETEPLARLFDSYGRMIADDAGAHADNFAIQLREEPDMDGYIICYGPEGEGSGTANFILESQMNYFFQVRGVDLARLTAVNAGRYKELSQVQTEYWLIPHGDKPPEPKRYNSTLKEFTGKLIEFKSWDGFPDGDVGGPEFGNVTIAALADLLRQQHNFVAYIVAFNGNASPTGTWRRIARRDVVNLEGYGIKADRIKIIFGGVTKKAEDVTDEREALVQIWVLPSDAPPPAKEAKPERTPKKAFQIGTYNDYLLKDKEQERLIFAGFADVVHVDKNLNLYIITRPRIEPTEKISPDEPDDIDTQKLGEKWKSELVEKFGIDENRIFVIKAAADEFREGEIDVWVTPPGIPLPNTYSSDEDIQSDNG